MATKKILGIDPGTGICGFGVISVTENQGTLRGTVKMLDAGVIATPPHTSLPVRLEDIYNSLNEIVAQWSPDMVSIEKLFFSKNITTGISVAEARGICILVARQHRLPIYEYTPNEIKKTLTGYGSADKPQMQEMVRIHLGMDHIIKPDDAADALAAAITHTLMYQPEAKNNNLLN
ncbi:crossover junction endodeoxyribonuclease RuvC [Candidatus Saccharibacteria bacterium]|nr:crossover junction endodeoxyribonuclease RuvC [Candidatus Saccharibacteria bacterium]